METNLSKNAQSIQALLAHMGVASRVVEFASSTKTAQDAANSIGCTVGQIAKSILFKTKNEHTPILVLVSGANRVNEAVLAALLGEPLAKADAEFTREVTGFAIGGIPPLGHKQQLKTFIDQDLLSFAELWAAAGTPHAVFNITPNDLLRTTGGTVISVT